jgi:Fic family protein
MSDQLPQDNEFDESAHEIAVADSLYQGFPDFSSWAKQTVQTDVWDRWIGGLTAERSSASSEDFKQSVEIAMRAAAIDTGAIEGLYEVDRRFTMTVATQATAWQAQIEERGDKVRDLFRAQLATYELVLDAATNDLPITEAWTRRIHEEVCRFQDTYRVMTPLGVQEQELPKGQYKTQPNHVRLPDGSVLAYAPVHATAPEMERLISNLSGPEFKRAPPVLQASYVHYALSVIHPFADGNGRVARAVASTFFYQAASIPLLIFADQRAQYIATLRLADAGNYRPFIDFILQRGLTAAALVSEALKTAKAPPPEDVLQQLRGALTTQGGLTHQELDQVGKRLVGLVATEFSTQLSSLSLPAGVNGAAQQHGGSPIGELPGFRPIGDSPPFVQVNFNSQSPANANVVANFSVLISRPRDESESFVLIRDDGQERLLFSLHDVYPEESAAASIQLREFVRSSISQLLVALSAAAQDSLRQAGYD